MGNRGRNVLARTFGAVALISLLAFGGVCAMWVLSYTQPKTRSYLGRPNAEPAHWTTFGMHNGNLEWMFCYGTRHIQPGQRSTSWSIGWYGMSLSKYDQGWAGHRKLHFYFRDLAVVTALVPGWWLVLHRRLAREARAAAAGLCPNCGYDLRASRDRCPECGTPIKE